MKNEIINEAPVYQKIAIDIAKKIINGKYSLGEKLSGRSTLATEYRVSPETIRKSVYILKEFDILNISKGSGIEIKSIENAIRYMEQYGESQTINSIKKDIHDWIKRQKKENEKLLNSITKLLEITDKFEAVNPFTPLAIRITPSMNFIGKTSAEVMFWNHTGATIFAIKHGEKTILSPGPQTVFQEGDILYFIGDEQSYDRVKNFFTSAIQS